MASSNTRHRTFGSHNKKATKVPVTFDLLGYDEEADKEYTATFTARPKLPGMAVLEFAATGAGEDASGSITAVFDFYQKALTKSEYDRFKEFVDDPRYDVELETLIEIIGFLVEEYASRPTEAPSQ